MNRSQKLRQIEREQKEQQEVRHDLAENIGDRHGVVLRPIQVGGELLAAGHILPAADLARFKPGNLAALVTGRRLEIRFGPAPAGPASNKGDGDDRH